MLFRFRVAIRLEVKLCISFVVDLWRSEIFADVSNTYSMRIDPGKVISVVAKPMVASDRWSFADPVSSKWWHWMIHDYTLHICEFFQCQDPPEPSPILLADQPMRYLPVPREPRFRKILQINIVSCTVPFIEILSIAIVLLTDKWRDIMIHEAAYFLA